MGGDYLYPYIFYGVNINIDIKKYIEWYSLNYGETLSEKDIKNNNIEIYEELQNIVNQYCKSNNYIVEFCEYFDYYYSRFEEGNIDRELYNYCIAIKVKSPFEKKTKYNASNILKYKNQIRDEIKNIIDNFNFLLFKKVKSPKLIAGIR